MAEEEIELVAELLAKVGGSWFPERAGSAGKMVTGRQRDVARLILAELDRLEAARRSSLETDGPAVEADGAQEKEFSIGDIVEYCPPGDKRTITCRIEKTEPGRAYLVPEGREIGWVSTHTLLPLKS